MPPKVFAAPVQRASRIMLAALAFVLVSATLARAGQVPLAWNPDDDAIAVGYRVHVGTSSGTYADTIDVGNVTEYAVTGLEEGRAYYFTVTSYGVDGFESAPAPEVRAMVPGATVSGITIGLVPADTSLLLDATNYSTHDTLMTYTWPDRRVANAILMKFDLSSIPAGALVEDATLELSLVASDASADTAYMVSAHKVVGRDVVIARATGYTADGVNGWKATACCYNNVPLAQADISAPYDQRPVDKLWGRKAWTLTSMVQEWVANPAGNFGLVLNSDAAAPADRYRYFASIEHPDASLRPVLRITYAPPLPADVTGPSVFVTRPSMGENVSGTVTVAAEAFDDVALAGVQFEIDGVPFGAELTAAPFTSTWDTTAVSDGVHRIAAVARDAAGNATPAAAVDVTVSNGIVWLTPRDTSLNLDAANYSTHAELMTYTWPHRRVANAILMKFTLSAIPQGAIIQEATLHLALVESDASADSTYTIAAHKVIGRNPAIGRATGYTTDGTTSWTANSQCHDSVPLAQADISAAYDQRAVDKARGAKSWDLTSMVQEWVSDPTTNFGLLLNSDWAAAADRYRYFASMEHPNPKLRPILFIRYVK